MGKEIQSESAQHVAFTADGRWLAVGLLDGTLRLMRTPRLPPTTDEMRLRAGRERVS